MRKFIPVFLKGKYHNKIKEIFCDMTPEHISLDYEDHRKKEVWQISTVDHVRSNSLNYYFVILQKEGNTLSIKMTPNSYDLYIKKINATAIDLYKTEGDAILTGVKCSSECCIPWCVYTFEDIRIPNIYLKLSLLNIINDEIIASDDKINQLVAGIRELESSNYSHIAKKYKISDYSDLMKNVWNLVLNDKTIIDKYLNEKEMSDRYFWIENAIKPKKKKK